MGAEDAGEKEREREREPPRRGSSRMERKSGSEHARFVILAEFDIGLGSVIREQVPRATGVSDTFLAEAMLPEGSHSRTEDETVFMLPLGKSQDSSNGSESKKVVGMNLSPLIKRKKNEKIIH